LSNYEYFNQALPLYQQTKNRAAEALVLQRLGIIYQTIGKSQTAVNYLNQAQIAYQETNNQAQ